MKIYILGDSFTDNLFKYEIDAINNNENRDPSQIYQYIKLLKENDLEYPLHFGDYLKLWGHEVINLGIGGCSNESIYHQFTQIKEPFDRLIVNWTGLARFDWIQENLTIRTFTGGMDPGTKLTKTDELLIEQGFHREKSEVLRNRTIDFISYFTRIYKKQKPIIWTPFENISELIKNQKGFIWDIKELIFKNFIPERDKLEIFTESNKKINDRHYGRYGNFYTALVFNTILEHTKDIEHDGYYINDLNLISKIQEKLQSTQHNIIELKDNFI